MKQALLPIFHAASRRCFALTQKEPERWIVHESLRSQLIDEIVPTAQRRLFDANKVVEWEILRRPVLFVDHGNALISYVTAMGDTVRVLAREVLR